MKNISFFFLNNEIPLNQSQIGDSSTNSYDGKNQQFTGLDQEQCIYNFETSSQGLNDPIEKVLGGNKIAKKYF